MKMLNSLTRALLILVLTPDFSLASQIGDAAVAATVNQAASIGGAILLRGLGYQPEIVVNSNGTTAVVTNTVAPNHQTNPTDSYAQQNNQADKQAFFVGS